MFIKKLSKAIFVVFTCAVLAACSTAGTNGNGCCGKGAGDDSEGGAVARGLGDETAFDGSGGFANKMAVGNQIYYFDFDRSDVRDSDLASLKVQADYLATHPRAKVLLTGNTDERGSREYNIGLGEHRAISVKAILEADGVGRNQIITVSYGAEKPIALGHDEASYSKNRRVELIYKTRIR